MAPTPTPKQLHIGMVYWDTVTQAFQLMVEGAKAGASLGNVDFTAVAPPDLNDAAKLASDFTALAPTHTDGMILQSLAADPLYRPVLAATEAGIPVIAIDAPPPDNAGVTLFITNDNKALGKMLVDRVLRDVPADKTGEVVIGTNGPSVPPLQDRVAGMQAEIKAKWPNLTIVGPISTYGTQGSPSENYTAWNGILQAHPNAVAYLAPGAQDAVSMAQWEQHSNTKINCGGMDIETGAVDAVKNGYVTALVSPEHWLKGYIALTILMNHAYKGTPIPTGTWDTGGLVVDSSNIADVEARQASTDAMIKFMTPEAQAVLDKYGYKG
jgi:ribose transport system substrate-binding protein